MRIGRRRKEVRSSYCLWVGAHTPVAAAALRETLAVGSEPTQEVTHCPQMKFATNTITATASAWIDCALDSQGNLHKEVTSGLVWEGA